MRKTIFWIHTRENRATRLLLSFAFLPSIILYSLWNTIVDYFCGWIQFSREAWWGIRYCHCEAGQELKREVEGEE